MATLQPPVVNGTSEPSNKPIQLTISLPNAIQAHVHIHLTVLATSILLLLTTSGAIVGGEWTSDVLHHPGEEPSSSVGRSSLGSMVYAMPDRLNPPSTLSTPLFSIPSTIDTTTRIAKILARRLGMPVYVGNSMHFGMMGNGGSAEEEMGAVGGVIRVVVEEVNKANA